MLSRRRLLGGAGWLVGAMLTGCGRPAATLRALGEDDLILAYGDSLTFGTGASPMDSYPAHLARLSGREVVNAGVPGEVSRDGLRRLPRLLDAHQPALVVLCHGGNDILRRMNRRRAAANLVAMVELVRERSADAVLLGVPDFGLFLSAADFYAEVASTTGVPYEADALSDILGDSSLKSDKVHPNGEGYERLARAVDALLRRHGALPG